MLSSDAWCWYWRICLSLLEGTVFLSIVLEQHPEIFQILLFSLTKEIENSNSLQVIALKAAHKLEDGGSQSDQ